MTARRDILAGKASILLSVNNSQFVKGLKQARQNLAQFGSDILAMGRQMAAISAGMIAPLAFASRTFASFDDAMRQVKAVTGATGEAFLMLTSRAKELGRTTSFTAMEVGALMAELGRAGFDPKQIAAMTGAVLDLARATSTDATIASGIMAASIRQFGLSATDATRVADGLTAAANKSFNTVEQLGEALSYAGPVAQDFNVSLEDTLAILGGLGNVGIQGSNAGTALRRLLTLTGAEAEKLKGIFGVSFVDAAGNARPLVESLNEVNEATKDLGTAARAQKFNEAFGLLGITGASAISRAAGDIEGLAEEIRAATGIAAEAAAEMDRGLGGSFRIFRSALEGVQIAIGEALDESLSRVVKAGTDVLGIITAIVSVNKDVVVAFAKWGAVIGGVGAALIGMGLAASVASVSIGGLLGMIGMASAAFSLAVAPITAVGIAVGATRSAFMALAAVMAIGRAAVISLATSMVAVRIAIAAATAATVTFRTIVGLTSVAAIVLGGAVQIVTAAFVGVRAVIGSTTALMALMRTASISLTVTIAGLRIGLLAATSAAGAMRVGLVLATSASIGTRAAMIVTTAAISAMRAVMISTVVSAASMRVAFVALVGGIVAVRSAMFAATAAVIAVRTAGTATVAILGLLRSAFLGVATGSAIATAATAAFSAMGAVIAAITSPVALAAAAVIGLGYFALRAAGGFGAISGAASSAFGVVSSTGSSVLSRLGALFTQVKGTALAAFGGIRDAIAGGDLQLAGQIAMTALRVVFLQGMKSIQSMFSGTMADIVGTFGKQIAGGDFAGAWATVVASMSNLWESFAAGIVSVFASAAKSVTEIWQNTVDGITSYILKQASQGGAFGKAFEMMTGIDMQAEAERDRKSKALAAKLGLGNQASDFDRLASGTYQDPATKALADSIKSAIDGLEGGAIGRLADSMDEVASQTAGGAGAMSPEIARLRSELEALTQAAATTREQAASAAAANPFGGGAGGMGGNGSFATFSAAAAVAMGQGGAKDAAVEATEKTNRELREIKKQQREDARLLRAEIANLGLVH